MDLDLFGREIGRRGGARPHDLGQMQRAVLSRIRAAAAVVQRPRAAGVQPLGHDHQAGAQSVAVERGVRAERLVKLGLERRGRELGREFAPKRLGQGSRDEVRLEHARAHADIERLQVVDRHSRGQPRRDDRSGRRAADQVEVVREQGRLAEPLLHHGLDDLQVLKGQDAANAAPVQGEDALGGAGGVEVLLLGDGHPAPPSILTDGSRRARAARRRFPARSGRCGRPRPRQAPSRCGCRAGGACRQEYKRSRRPQ